MFELGFWELVVIAVVALLVIGPDRLPAVARTVGLWVGRIRAYMGSLQSDLKRELAVDEEQRQNLDRLSRVDELQQRLMSDVMGEDAPFSGQQAEKGNSSHAQSKSPETKPPGTHS